MNITVQFILLMLCLAAQAFFAGMETGILCTNRVRIQHMMRKKIRGAGELNYFLHHPELMLSTTLVGTNLFMVISSVIAASIAIQLMGTAGSSVSTIAMTLIVLIFAEYLPKSWFQSNPAIRTSRFTPVLRFFSYIFYPIGKLIMSITKIFFGRTSGGAHFSDHTITKEELAHLTLETERTGALSITERDMIQGVFDLDRKTCSDIMTPREDIITVSITTPRDELLELARECKHNRYPVYRDHPDNIVGIVNVFEVALDRMPQSPSITRYMRPPQFVPVNIPPDDLLPRMRLSRQPMALVTDTNAHVIGLVTIEDVLEEIVGDMTPGYH